MKFSFFHIGNDLSMPEMFCQSAKHSLAGNCQIIQISDHNTPQTKSSDTIIRLNNLNLEYPMLARMRAYQKTLALLKEPILFFDTDMLITRGFSIDLREGSPILCRRSFNLEASLNTKFLSSFGQTIEFPEHSGELLGSYYPYLGCFFADKTTDFLDLSLIHI